MMGRFCRDTPPMHSFSMSARLTVDNLSDLAVANSFNSIIILSEAIILRKKLLTTATMGIRLKGRAKGIGQTLRSLRRLSQKMIEK